MSMSYNKPQVLILGAGAVGAYFGARLHEAGIDVTFLVRHDRAQQLQRCGLHIISPCGDIALQPRLRTVATLDSDYDLVIIACKAYHLSSALRDAAKAVGTTTMVLPLLNGITHLQQMDQAFGPSKVLGGLCQIGVTLVDAGVVQHLHTLHHLIFGARCPEQHAVAHELTLAFGSARFDFSLSENIVLRMWEKLVFIATLAGATCLFRGPLNMILHTDEGARWVSELFTSCIDIATAVGYPPTPEFIDRFRTDLTDRTSTWTSSMFRDIGNSAPTEFEHIFGPLLWHAQQYRINADLLRIVYTHMQVYTANREAGLAD